MRATTINAIRVLYLHAYKFSTPIVSKTPICVSISTPNVVIVTDAKINDAKKQSTQPRNSNNDI